MGQYTAVSIPVALLNSLRKCTFLVYISFGTVYLVSNSPTLFVKQRKY